MAVMRGDASAESFTSAEPERMKEQLRHVGLIGLDNSHAALFTEMFHDPAHPQHVPGAKVVAAYPGGSPDIELSVSRVDQFTDRLSRRHGVRIVASPEAVAESCDMLLITSMDGRVHLEQLQRTIRYRRPTFVDKPMAHCHADAVEMFDLAGATGVSLMSCSSLRFSPELMAALADAREGRIVSCEAFGPFNELPMPPGLFWYGIHAVEVLFCVMGCGCERVQADHDGDSEVITGTWADGRQATVRRTADGDSRFGVVIHREHATQNVMFDVVPPYRPMLVSLLNAFSQNLSAVPVEETLEIIRFVEDANCQRSRNVIEKRRA